MSFPLTTQQRAVVTDRGGCLLVAAAAGSGKTRVLVERLLSRVEDEGLDIEMCIRDRRWIRPTCPDTASPSIRSLPTAPLTLRPLTSLARSRRRTAWAI